MAVGGSFQLGSGEDRVVLEVRQTTQVAIIFPMLHLGVDIFSTSVRPCQHLMLHVSSMFN